MNMQTLTLPVDFITHFFRTHDFITFFSNFSNNKNFELRVALAPLAKIGFNLTYQEVLQKKGYMYKHVINAKSELVRV